MKYKSGFFLFEVNGTPTVVSGGLNSLSVFDFSGNSENIMDNISGGYVTHTDGSGNHWAIGVFLADFVDNKRDSFWSYETNTSPKGIIQYHHQQVVICGQVS